MNNHNCFICDSLADEAAGERIAIFGNKSVNLSSGNNLLKVLTNILRKEIKETNTHSTIICKKCSDACVEYDEIEMRLSEIKKDLISKFTKTLPNYNLKYDLLNPMASIDNLPNAKAGLVQFKMKSECKKIVLPASKLKPLPPNYVILDKNKPFPMMVRGKQEANVSKQCFVMSPTKPVSSNSVLNTSTIKLLSKMGNNFLPPNTEIMSEILEDTASLDTSNEDAEIALRELVEKIQSEHADQPMDIDEDCSKAVLGANDTICVRNKDSIDGKLNENCFQEIDTSDTDQANSLIKLEAGRQTDGDSNKYVISKLEVMNDDTDDLEGDSDMILMEQDENGAIIRVVRSKNVIYSRNDEISLVMPQEGSDSESAHQDAIEDMSSFKIECQDSNDDSQIELQMSGDEETANAIIAATKEEGTTYITVESGETFQVKTIESKLEDKIDNSLNNLHTIVEGQGSSYKCLLCVNTDKEETTSEAIANAEDVKSEKEAVTGDARMIMQHIKTAHNARIYICEICGDVMRKRGDFTKHVADHADQTKSQLSHLDRTKQHECSVCCKKYSSKNLLEEHMNFHNGVRPYTCNICNKTFASKYTHHAHLKTHMDRPRPFSCGKCKKSFFTFQNLSQHEKTHSGVKDFICGVCGKAFGTQHNLEVHGVVHSGHKPFVCGVCGKAFARRAEIRDHMRTHTGERPYSCDLCGATFSQRSNLQSHRRATHLDDKRHACLDCDKRFKRRRLLEYHIKASHTGERPYKCDVCHATFVYPEHFKKHTRIHSGEKPYVCEVCGKTFNSRDNRNAHRFVHSDKKPYECLVCGAGYMRKPLLYAHMNSQGHLTDTIVVNQPRVNIDGSPECVDLTEAIPEDQLKGLKDNLTASLFTGETLMETIDESELENASENCDKAQDLYGNSDGTRQLIFTTEAGSITGNTTLSFVHDVEPGDQGILTLADHIVTSGIKPEEEESLETQDGQIDHRLQILSQEEAQQLLADDETGMLRLVQIQLPDGASGWVALNP